MVAFSASSPYELGDLLEAVDVNPLVVGPDGAVVVDALVLPPPRLTLASVRRRRVSVRASTHVSGGEGEGDRVGGEPAAAVLVEAVEAEVGDVDDVGGAGDGEVGGGLRDAGPHIIPWPPAAATTVPVDRPVVGDQPDRGSAGGRA